MPRASVTLDRAFTVAPVSRRLFGSFVEHMGRCVYTGIFEPGHPAADENGFRTDVLDLVRELGVSTIRYPGGNFVSNYRWEDGVGPREQRPSRVDLAWRSIETNDFGMHEFMDWCQQAGVEPMYAINLGTRGVQEAIDVLEYMTISGGTRLSDERIANGAVQPFPVTMFCLGNEMDGPWQTGHKTAHEYGRLAAEAARAMRQAKQGLELVACGSSGPDIATFADWEYEVLKETFDLVDFVSLHVYYEETDGDLASFLSSSAHLDRYIRSVIATADHVAASRKSDKQIMLSVDEWNVWYKSAGNPVQQSPDEYPIAPRIVEDTYSVADAVVVGDLLITMLNHSDRVTAASLAQLVNVIAPIRSEPDGSAWRQTTFYPFALTSKHATGTVLQVAATSSTHETNKYGTQPDISAAATLDEDNHTATVFLVNRSTEEAVVDVAARIGVCEITEALAISDQDPYARNTEASPDSIRPRQLQHVTLDNDLLQVRLPAVSWTMIRLRTAS